jgi:hypothetical protein
MDQAHGSVKKGPVVTGPAIVETIVVAPDSAPRGEEFRFGWHAGFWVLILAIVILCIWLLSGILLPFVAGIALGYLLDPVADRLQRVGLSRLGAALLMLVVFAVVLGLVLFLLVPVLTHQLTALIGALPGYVAKLPQFASELSSRATEGYGAQILDYLGLSGGFSPADCRRPRRPRIAVARCFRALAGLRRIRASRHPVAACRDAGRGLLHASRLGQDDRHPRPANSTAKPRRRACDRP